METTDERSKLLTRRGLIAATGTAAAGLVISPRLLPDAISQLSSASAAGSERFRSKLRIPRVITDADIEIPMRKASVQILPGPKTKMWTYDGSFPGPTLRRPAGESTNVTFSHQLPAKVGELTVHLHGGHNRSDDDGRPGGLTASHPQSLYCDISPRLSPTESGNDVLIEPGGSRTYNYALAEDGSPERAAFQWYHDHRLDNTAQNIWNGLAGMWIIDDAVDAALPLPTGDRDIPLMITDRSFDKHNQLTDPFRGGGAKPPVDGNTGKCVLVNGTHLPNHPVAATRHRLRILNASHFRAYEVGLSGGLKLTQIATDAGLMPKPITRSTILLGPGERAEVIVDFAKARGKRVRLVSSKRRDAPDRLGSKTYNGSLMEFRVSGKKATDETSIPATLRPLPSWVSTAPSQPSHSWAVTVSGGFVPTWLINGRAYDPSYSDVDVELDSTVTWELHNRTSVAHLLHLHHTDWYLLSRNGKPPPAWERCLKDTFFMDPGEKLLVAGHFSDYTGPFVIHCHMLDHEDHGLMSQFNVVPSGSL
jgi:spore coat protein A